MAEQPTWKKNKTAYNITYTREHYARVVMNVKPEVKERLQANAKAAGMTLTDYRLDRCL